MADTKILKNNNLLENARKLRREMTPYESRLWYTFLQKYPVKIYKQRIIGNYIVDFYCSSAKVVIELDGSQHHEPENALNDRIRDEYMNTLGLVVIRFSNHELDENFRGVCKKIDFIICSRIKDKQK